MSRAPGITRAELWLEIVTDDTKAAAEHLKAAGTVRCDEIEALGPNFDGFWISNPRLNHPSGGWEVRLLVIRFRGQSLTVWLRIDSRLLFGRQTWASGSVFRMRNGR